MTTVWKQKGNLMENKNKIGIQIACTPQTDFITEFQKAKKLGLFSCQLCIWETALYTDKVYAANLKEAIEQEAFTVTAIWAGWSGPREWNFTAGPETIGLVPPTYRMQRLEELKRASDFAEAVGVNAIVTHVGFIPEDMHDANFNGVVAALRHLCKYLKKKDQMFLFETGQETPVTLLRTIQEIGCDNLGINLDTANMILYGKANTLDSLDVFGTYVKNTHIKDGLYPTDGFNLGKETAAGEGKADIPAVIQKLRALGYTGPFTIEREISGEKQIEDIVKARDLIIQALQ